MKRNILIFSASIGSGHDAAADALRERFAKNKQIQVTVIDSFELIHPALHKAVSSSYYRTLRSNPKIWGYLYDYTAKGSDKVSVPSVVTLFFAKFKEVIERTRPVAVIATHFFPAAILSSLRGRNHLCAPLYVVPTDYHIHSIWLYPHVDGYFVASTEAFRDCLERGIRSEKLTITGIPIHSNFVKSYRREEICRRFGLDDRPVLLLSGGGKGLGDILPAAKALMTWGDYFQLLVIAGKNEALYQAIRPLALTHPNCHLFGYVDNMAELMCAADLLIGKSGGLTAAEAAAMALPLVICNPIPGQEEHNAAYLLAKGAAMAVDNCGELARRVYELIEDADRLTAMRDAIGKLGRKEASDHIYHLLGHLFSDDLERQVL